MSHEDVDRGVHRGEVGAVIVTVGPNFDTIKSTVAATGIKQN